MDPGQVEEHPDDMKILVDHAACLFAVLPPSWSLKMPLRRCSRVAVAICLFLDSATTTAICIGWKVEDIEWERVPYLLGCVAVATFVSMIRLVVFGGDAHQSSGAVQIVIVCGVLEAATLSAAITLVCLPQSARTCMEGKGPANICRFVVVIVIAAGLSLLLTCVGIGASLAIVGRWRHRVASPQVAV